MLEGRVFITGGSGFLGRGIMRQAAREKWPCKFTVFSRDEYKHHLCRDKFPDATYILGDVRDTAMLTLAMAGHDTVIHAAALKYVVESERNVRECVGINIQGSQSVIAAAIDARVNTVIFISTDKAVEPANIYGLTKAVAEKLFYEISWVVERPRFVTCRYGNVIGSTGSIIPVFAKQLEAIGHVKVTDPDMTRFWLSVDKAVDIIEVATTHATGTIVVPELKSISIGEIARHVARDKEKIKIVGARPGEKKHEKLLTYAESIKSLRYISGGYAYLAYNPGADIAGDGVPMELTSDQAPAMPIESFLAHVEDAALV